MKRKLLFVSISILIIFGVFWYMNQSVTTEVIDLNQIEPAITIVRTNDGYEPNEVSIKKGDVVLWVNNSDDFHWPASDLHPTHGVYSAFDPLKPVAPGEDWRFQFDQVGKWYFHDHLRANKVGSVTVTE